MLLNKIVLTHLLRCPLFNWFVRIRSCAATLLRGLFLVLLRASNMFGSAVLTVPKYTFWTQFQMVFIIFQRKVGDSDINSFHSLKEETFRTDIIHFWSNVVRSRHTFFNDFHIHLLYLLVISIFMNYKYILSTTNYFYIHLLYLYA